MPAGHAASAWTVVGGTFAGSGRDGSTRLASFGAVARPRFWRVGVCVNAGRLLRWLPQRHATVHVAGGQHALADASPLFHVSTLFAVAFLAFTVWRLRPTLRALRETGSANRLAPADMVAS